MMKIPEKWQQKIVERCLSGDPFMVLLAEIEPIVKEGGSVKFVAPQPEQQEGFNNE